MTEKKIDTILNETFKKRPVNLLPLKSAVVYASTKEMLSNLVYENKYCVFYIHGIQLIDRPYTELYLIGPKDMLDLDTALNAAKWVNRDKLTTITDFKRMVNMRDKEYLAAKKMAELNKAAGAVKDIKRRRKGCKENT